MAGLTLIELMVTLAVLAILLLTGLPLTQNWVYGAQVAGSTSLLLQGYDLAKSLALRNPESEQGDNPAAGLKLSGGSLLVCRGNPADASCDTAGASLVWKADLTGGKGVAVTIDGQADTTVSLNNVGIPDSAPGYSISKGSVHDAGTLH